MPTKYDTQRSRQQYEHMGHQEKQGLLSDDGLKALVTFVLTNALGKITITMNNYILGESNVKPRDIKR